jgi:alpha-L-glutamate ligase-like protein
MTSSLWSRLRAGHGDVVGINERNVELVYAHNQRTNYRFADDKLLAKECLIAHGVPVPETYVVCDGLHQVHAAVEALSKRAQFVVKPASSSGGNGIIVIGERTENGFLRASGDPFSADDLRRHLANILYGAFSDDRSDRAYAEARVVGHEVILGLFREGLSDIRVITLNGAPILSMLRVPTKQSDGRANLHQGALGLALDLDTGRVRRALHRGAPITHHPDTGSALIGLIVPAWPAVLDVASRAAKSVPLGYLGVDIVLAHDATPLVLEVNARPGLEIQNVHGRGLGAALRERGMEDR